MRLNPSGEKPTKRKNNIVVDTGVLVSAFAFGGVPGNAVKKAFIEYRVFVSPQILTEYRSIPLVLKAAGKITPEQFRALVAGIASFVAGATVVTPQKNIHICRDPKDDMFIDCCLEAQAIILLTSDKDLLCIADAPPGLEILRPKEFLVRP